MINRPAAHGNPDSPADARHLGRLLNRAVQLPGRCGVGDVLAGGDCQDFRVWPGIMGNKESHYVTTQRTCHTE